MAARTSIARSAHLFSSPRALSVGFRPQWRQATPLSAYTKARMFSVSSRAEEKKYTKDHEWVELDSDGKTVTLGISKYAADALGDVVYVELPTIDMEVSPDDAIGSVESVKSASDILCPVEGHVTETNGKLEETPGNLNKDPEGAAWIAKIQLKAASLGEAASGLMDEKEYKAYTDEVSEES